jgi:hypothetical protein
VSLAGTDFAGFYSVPMHGGAPSTAFFARIGFEIGLAYQTTHTREELIEEFLRLVQEHDKEGVDHLLVVAGAPGRNGLSFSSDAYLLDFMLHESFEIPPTKHISKIVLHFWGIGRIIELLPARQEIGTRLYSGYGPPHFSAADAASGSLN